ncbi:hypothetical protein FHS59_002990 [Algoriphagus iocasae]|uniref:DUF4153 domain-containing protein n=1 Tax=Algoriphagus iocasae TaxID=1836499 RepID=A0A841MPB4_9BACT|nr:hypothetical protein [Algoriphagus iocasae]MBB6327347.1 hypothetical protein [Algoriphagus iocasae]
MKEEILSHLDDPATLEKLYRSNKSIFKESLLEVSKEVEGNPAIEFWKARLSYDSNSISWGVKNELIYVVIGCFIAGLIAKLPDIFSISKDFYFPRNIGFIVFPVLIAYFAWINKLSRQVVGFFAGFISICIIYINSLPNNLESDTLILACIHLPLLLWVVLGVSFAGEKYKNINPRLEFLRFNGEAAVICAVIGIAGALLTAITFGLFELIGINMEPIFEKYIIVFGLPSVPILAAFLTQTNPQLVNKVTPIIAKLFSPAVLIMLTAYLIAIFYTGKDPYNDREFLLIFNILLIGVMALIFFSIAEHSVKGKISLDIWVLMLLSLVTIIVNGIALSAILFRISEWGITPNRMAVLGSNILMLVHLLMIAFKIFKTIKGKTQDLEVGKSIASFIPIYAIWTIIVVFLFPLVFNFQ